MKLFQYPSEAIEYGNANGNIGLMKMLKTGSDMTCQYYYICIYSQSI